MSNLPEPPRRRRPGLRPVLGGVLCTVPALAGAALVASVVVPGLAAAARALVPLASSSEPAAVAAAAETGPSWLQAAVLAVVQGITEFLPISSSAHLILVPHLFAWPDQGLVFDVAVNTGTLVAVVAYFRRDLVDLARAWGASFRGERSAEARLAWGVLLGTVPVGLCGLLFYDLVAGALRSPLVIATTSIGFGLLLWWADRAGARARDLDRLAWRDVLVVGLAQAVALVPGTSRSGVTITAGLALGLEREAAARFSFLLAVPVGALAALHDLGSLGAAVAAGTLAPAALGPMVLASALAALSAYLVIGWFLAWLRRLDMTPFVVYRLLLGALLLVLFWP